jgi:thioredoxin 1
VPKGSAGVQNITVLVNGNPSKPSTDFAYNSPSVANIQPAHGKPVGGTKVVIQGKDFGFRRPVPGALVASIGGRKCLKTTWKSDSEVECVAPEGTGSCKAVTVRVGARDSQVSASNTLWHYEDAPDATKTHVLRLNPGNFDEIVNGDRPVMINFCTRGCEVCQKLKPVYEEIARMLTCKSVVIATVRVDQHPSLAKRFSLKDTFPRMLFFSEGRTTPSAEFNGKLVAENILGFMARQMRLGAAAEDEPVNALKPVVDGFVVGQPNQGMKRCSKMETVQVNSSPILPMKRL